MNLSSDKRPSRSDMAGMLSRARPEPTSGGRELPPERVAAISRAMRDSSANLVSVRPRARRPRRIVVAAAGLAVLTAGSGAVAWAIARHRPAANPLTVACHSEARLDSSVVALTADRTPPVELCTRAWDDGDFGPGTAPPLIACTGTDGPAEVFPGSDDALCETLGMSPLSEQAVADRDAEVQFQDSISDRLVDVGCIDAKQLEGIVADELERAGLEDWAVSVRGEPSGDLRCATPTIDPVGDSVVIEFLPDIWATSPSPDQGDP